MRKLQVLCSETSSLRRQHFLRGKKVLRTHSCEACKRALSLQVKQTRNPCGLWGRLDQPFSLSPTNFRWPAGDSSLLPHVQLKQASHIRPRITRCLLGEWNLLKFSCWLQDLFPGTVCFHRKRKCYRKMQFSLPCCSSDSKQIWISCIRYV